MQKDLLKMTEKQHMITLAAVRANSDGGTCKPDQRYVCNIDNL